jgi:hypothetical protein
MRLIACVIFALALISCKNSSSGSGGSSQEGAPAVSAPQPCGSSIVSGSWHGAIMGQPDTMTFNADCSGTASYCQATFTYPAVTASSGQVLVTNTSTNGAVGCLPLGLTKCAYQVEGSSMSIFCGGSTFVYTK